jgi:hypothetical protein
VTTDRSVPGWWRSGHALCRACGAQHAGVRPLVCAKAECAAWLSGYSAALASGAVLPPEYGVRAPTLPVVATSPLVATTRHPKRKGSRSVTRRFEAQAHANDLLQAQRKVASRRRGEDVIESPLLTTMEAP